MSTSIVAIGSANTEQILAVDQIVPGSKCNCARIVESFGGSAVNWGMRFSELRKKVEEVGEIYVACPIGGDDTGTYIRNKLEESGINVIPQIPLGPEQKTSHSFVLVYRGDRTIFTKVGSAVNKWALSLADSITTGVRRDVPLIAMIGNIAKTNDEDGNACHVTEHVINALPEDHTACIYTNFGRAQYSFCYHHWTKVWDRIDFFQLNADEAREFIARILDCEACKEMLRDRKIELPQNLSLHSILSFFRDIETTAVITLAGSGSVAVTKKSNKVIFTWPKKPTKHLDTTGSGDAFGAGVICALLVHKDLQPHTVQDYADLFSVGSIWGACACEQYGGHKGIPATSDLMNCLTKKTLKKYPSISKSIKDAEPLLYMLDRKEHYFTT